MQFYSADARHIWHSLNRIGESRDAVDAAPSAASSSNGGLKIVDDGAPARDSVLSSSLADDALAVAKAKLSQQFRDQQRALLDVRDDALARWNTMTAVRARVAANAAAIQIARASRQLAHQEQQQQQQQQEQQQERGSDADGIALCNLSQSQHEDDPLHPSRIALYLPRRSGRGGDCGGGDSGGSGGVNGGRAATAFTGAGKQAFLAGARASAFAMPPASVLFGALASDLGGPSSAANLSRTASGHSDAGGGGVATAAASAAAAAPVVDDRLARQRLVQCRSALREELGIDEPKLAMPSASPQTSATATPSAAQQYHKQASGGTEQRPTIAAMALHSRVLDAVLNSKLGGRAALPPLDVLLEEKRRMEQSARLHSVRFADSAGHASVVPMLVQHDPTMLTTDERILALLRKNAVGAP